MPLKTRRSRSLFGLLFVCAAIALALAACSSAASAPAPAQGNPGINTGAGVAGDKGVPVAAATAAPAALPGAPGATGAPLLNDHSLIIKTGQLTLQVSNVEGSTAQANGIVTGNGGYIAGSSRGGDGDKLSVSATYRIPVARWDATLDAIHHASGGGTISIVDEQIQTQDVTAAAADLDARLTNLRASEQALLGIMARATTIADTLAVQEQLTTVRGQIEELQAQRNTMGDQASYSTLTVQFQAVPKTETTTAASGWNLGSTVDDATASLVKIGQALASLAVWVLIVGGPLAVLLLIGAGLYRLLRRIRRGKGGTPATSV